MAERRLDRAAVVATAARLVDRDGWQNLTMSALASKLGIRVPSVYNHIESLEGVLAAVQVDALRSLGEDLRTAAMGRVGVDGMRALALAVRAFALDRPGCYDLAMREPIDQPAMRAASSSAGQAVDAVIASFGVTAISRELQLSCLAVLHGVLVLERSGLFGLSVDFEAVYDQMIAVLVGLAESAARAEALARRTTRRR